MIATLGHKGARWTAFREVGARVGADNTRVACSGPQMTRAHARTIPGSRGYMATEAGEILSPRTGTALRPTLDTSGYGQVSVTLNGSSRRTYRVCVLVALAFLGERPLGAEVCHADGCRTNDRLDNLRYASRSENSLDAVKHGTHQGFKNRGSANGLAKLTAETAVIVANRVRAGERPADVAGRYGVTPAAIRAVMRGISWSHATGIPKAIAPKRERETRMEVSP